MAAAGMFPGSHIPYRTPNIGNRTSNIENQTTGFTISSSHHLIISSSHHLIIPLQQNQSFHLHDLPCLELIKIRSARKPARIPQDIIGSRCFLFIDKSYEPSSGGVVYAEMYQRRHGYLVTDH